MGQGGAISEIPLCQVRAVTWGGGVQTGVGERAGRGLAGDCDALG